ncbi:MAG TPA: hypothetical protein VFO18_12445 [Methylomirabilota bacterium]|nr:hypothetical protein [Methylomirabilota bacterium]
MLDSADGQGTDTIRAGHDTNVALGVAWLVAMARAFRVRADRKERLDEELRAAQADLIRAILLACADGLSLQEVLSRFIEPALSRPAVMDSAAFLLRDAVRSVQEHLGSAAA